jgi:transcription elongation factor Elf1
MSPDCPVGIGNANAVGKSAISIKPLSKSMKNELRLTPPKNFTITDEDIAVHLGSGEILNCPFCGSQASSAGIKNELSGNTVYSVRCNGSLQCTANAFSCCKDPVEARINAIARWNRRTPNPHTEVLKKALEEAKDILTACSPFYRNGKSPIWKIVGAEEFIEKTKEALASLK